MTGPHAPSWRPARQHAQIPLTCTLKHAHAPQDPHPQPDGPAVNGSRPTPAGPDGP